MGIRPDCATLPWLTAAVGIAGVTARFFLPNPTSWSWVSAWPVYCVYALITGLLLFLAFLGWQCHRERIFASMPPEATIRLLAQLSGTGGWTGTPAEFIGRRLVCFTDPHSPSY